MKKTLLSACILLLGLPVSASGLTPVDLIQGVGDDILEGYAAPLVESYGMAMGTGLYHSANAHEFLGFDIGARMMLVRIPTSAKTFDAVVPVYRWDDKTRSFIIETTIRENAATIFGKPGLDSLYDLPPGSAAVPPVLPGGLGISVMPFLVPQASIGLPIPGAELMVRYIPWPFEGTTVNFLGFGLKEEITALPGIDLPFNIAVQGFYQRLTIGDIVSSTSYGFNLHLSKSLLLLAPYAGIGINNTSMAFDYSFDYDKPVGYDPETGQIETTPDSKQITMDFTPDANVQATVGAAFKLGLILVNVDYNHSFSSGYGAINFGAGVALR